MRKSLLIFIFASIILGTSSCDDQEINHVNWIDELFNGDLIRGSAIGDNLESVQKSLGEPEMVINDELVYRGIFSNGLRYDHYVNMDANEVFEITVDLFSENDSLNDLLFEELVKVMDQKYHKSSPADGYATWKTPSPSGRLVEVSLVDESMEYGRPLIMLNYLENYERTFTED